MKAQSQDALGPEISAIRSFTRFYTGFMGVLNQHLYDTEFSVTEARVLMEISDADQIRASEIASNLDLDPAYLSRILKRFETHKQIERRPDPEDLRGRCLTLTKSGKKALADLIRSSNVDVASKISHLSPTQRQLLAEHLDQAQSLLATAPQTHSNTILRDAEVGDIGWMIHRQSQFYAETFGWNEAFEHVVIEILAEYLKNAEATHDRCWIAERDDQVIGSIFLQRQDDHNAKLRLLFVEPSAQGTGLGGKLVDACIAQARRNGYARLSLWTVDRLGAAKALYESRGFVLTKEAPVRQFGQDLVNLTYALDL